MKLFKVFLSLFVIVLAILLVSRFMPHEYKVEKQITINKNVESVYAFMSDFKNWEKWSLWNKSTDSTLGYFYGKTSQGGDARQYFHGDLLGIGRFKFDTCESNKRLVYNLYMHAGEIKASGVFKFDVVGENTILTWVDAGDVGDNPIYRFMLSSKVENTAKTFEDGLQRIKKEIEN